MEGTFNYIHIYIEITVYSSIEVDNIWACGGGGVWDGCNSVSHMQ